MPNLEVVTFDGLSDAIRTQQPGTFAYKSEGPVDPLLISEVEYLIGEGLGSDMIPNTTTPYQTFSASSLSRSLLNRFSKEQTKQPDKFAAVLVIPEQSDDMPMIEAAYCLPLTFKSGKAVVAIAGYTVKEVKGNQQTSRENKVKVVPDPFPELFQKPQTEELEASNEAAAHQRISGYRIALNARHNGSLGGISY